MNVSLTVNKSNVLNEVFRTTSYTGIKMTGDDGAYERIFASDVDKEMLERFWTEAGNAVTDLLKPFINSITTSTNFALTLVLPSNFESSLTSSIESSMTSFFVNYIVGQWYRFTNKSEAEEYVQLAKTMLDDVKAKIYYRKKPTRTAPNN